MKISQGFLELERATVAELYWEAFGAKLGRVLGPKPKALAFLDDVLAPDYALVARDADDVLLGVAGFKTDQGALVGGELADLAEHYGWFGALWRGLVLNVLERDVKPGVFLMDGIFVQPQARGQGVGTALLEAIAEAARDAGADVVRLDVINTNPRARALYEAQGFVAVGRESLGPLRHVFGFESATKMELPL